MISPRELPETEFDTVIVASLMGLAEIRMQLEELGVPECKVDRTYAELSVRARIAFIERLSERIYKSGIRGAVAEAGVYRGEFAKEINRCFKDRKLYLFDTFRGFDARDYKYEEKPSLINGVEHYKETSIEMVLKKMPYRGNVAVQAGYFPESLGGLDDDFVFVSLDMDLYLPTLEGLRFFYPRLNEGGVILVHDYFTELYPNIEKAVDDYESGSGIRLHKIPIGDDISIAIVK